MPAIPSERGIIQFSWVVADLDEAMRRWHRTTGVGPFLVQRHITINQPRYRGEPSSIDFSVALTQAGPVQIELVQQHCDSPSCYRDTVAAGQEAMHHVAIMPDDYDAALASYLDQGFAEAAGGLFGDVRFSYVDTAQTLGHMVEVVEPKETIRRFFGAIARAAETWDGDAATLVREL
jgi:hypothetical protein